MEKRAWGCTCAHMCVCVLCMHADTCSCTRVCVSACLRLCPCVFIHVHVFAGLEMCTYTCIYVCDVCMCVHA